MGHIPYDKLDVDPYCDFRHNLKYGDKVVGVVIHDGGMNLNISDGTYDADHGQGWYMFGFDCEMYLRQMDLRYIFPDRESAHKGAADCVKLYSMWKYDKIDKDCQHLIDLCEVKWGDKV